MKLRYTAAWVGLAAAAAAATAACGGQGSPSAADRADLVMAALTRAGDRTGQAGSAEVSVTTDLGNGKPIAMEGVYSWGDGFAFDVQMDTEAAQLRELTDSPTVRTLFVDGAYYYDIDPQPAGPLAGKEWLRIDASALVGEQGVNALSGAGGGDPTASLRSLRYADDVEDLGEEKVDGRSATHYRAVVDPRKLGRLKDVYGEDSVLNPVAGGTGPVRLDVWVGGNDLPVRMRQEFGAMTVTMDFERFGAAKAVQAPPAARTGDLTAEVKDAAAGQPAP